MTSEEKLRRIMHGGATPEHRVEMLRELISEEVARQLQREPIPGPSFEGGAAAEWEPKRGDLVEVVDSRGFDPDSEIKAGDVVKCVGKRNGRLFLLQGSGQYLAKASVYQIKPISIGEEPTQPAPTRPEIIPAEPLRVVPGQLENLFMVIPFGRILNIVTPMWKGTSEQIAAFQAGLCFPDTPAGRLGAELRAKQGIVPYPVQPAGPEDNRPAPGIMIPFKEYEEWMTTYSDLCDSFAIHFDDDEPRYVRDFQKATDSMILSASRNQPHK